MGPDGAQGAWTYLVPLIAIAVIVLRSLRARVLRVKRMWITPTLILAAVALTFSVQAPPRFPVLVAEAFVLGLGAGLGWWRGRTTEIRIDPQTGALTRKASPLGTALIAGVFLLRFAFRDYALDHASGLGVTPVEIADVFLLFAASLICTQRLEMWLRARRLLKASTKDDA